jgi:putative DNA primase/helicase
MTAPSAYASAELQMATTLSTQVSILVDESIRPYIEYGDESGTPGANDKSRRVSFEDVKEATKGSIESVVRWLLPNGKLVDNGKEWVALNTARADKKLGSFKVNLRNKPGVWSDFAIGQSGGDLIDLYVYLKGVDKVEAKDAIADYLSVKPSAGSTSLTGNIPATRPRLEKAAAAPIAISAAPTKFPPRTPSDQDGKPVFIVADDEGPRASSTEKRRHVYRRGGIPVRIKIIKKDKKGAFNAYRATDAGGVTGWQFAKPDDYEDVPYFFGDNPFDTEIDRVIFWPEGEKDVETVAKLGGLAFTFGGTGDGWPNGCELYVADRNVVILADNDGPGREHAEKKAALASKVAASVKVIHFPELHEHQDVSDWIAGGKTFNDLKARVLATEPWQPSEPGERVPDVAESKLPYGYSFSNRGLMWKDPDNAESAAMHIAGCFDIEAMTRDSDGNSWGLLLRWKDPDGRDHRFPLARELLAGDGLEARRVLTSQGFYIAPNPSARTKFNAFLLQVTSPNRALSTGHVGWNGTAFVLPDDCFGGNSGETLLLQNATAQEHSFRKSGTLEEWQEIALLAVSNSRLTLAISMAFVGPLLGPCSEEGGGVHFKGSSSIGKTTALHAGGSVWGGGDANGFVRTWRATTNGLEGVCLNHSDTFLCLDEMAQVGARDAGEAAYMIANGSGKSRSRTDGSARRTAKFRVMFLSSGEIGLADKVAEESRGKRITAGQQVRIIDVPADAGAGHGLFEILHGFESGKALSKHIFAVAKRTYGTAGRAFLAAVVPGIDDIKRQAEQITAAFCELYLPAGADGQVARVAQRFALIAFAGELATRMRILPWKAGDAVKAAGTCFEAWLRERGHTGAAEVEGGIEAVRSFLEAHGMARFVPAWEEDQNRYPPQDVCGFRKKVGEGWEFYVNDSGWAEMCSGFAPKTVAKALVDKGVLIADSDGRVKKSVRVPDHGKKRYYNIAASFLQDEEN